MEFLPKIKSSDIVVQDLGSELLIYDLKNNKAFCLNETSMKVYKSCDGETTFEQLKQEHQFTDNLIHLALDELKRNELLEAGINYNSPFAGMSRREVIRKVGFASMIALPIISSIVAPSAAMAGSGAALGAACSPTMPCSTGTCKFCVLSCTSPQICCTNSTPFAFPPGTTFNCGALGASDPSTTNCCNGTATLISPNTCRCN